MSESFKHVPGARFCNTIEPSWHRVVRSLETSFSAGQLSNFGPLYKKLCVALAVDLGLPDNKRVVVTSSGHTALMASYSAMGARRLAIPAYTFEATRAAATLQGIETVIFDVDTRTGTFYINDLYQRAAEYDAICLVAPLSVIPDLRRFRGVARELGKKLILDGAAAYGTPGIWDIADISCISLHATKSFPVGEGGIVICDKETEEVIKEYINFGFDAQRNVARPGLNAKISEYTCAIALDLLEKLDVHLAIRRGNARLFEALLGTHASLQNHGGPDTVYQCYTVYARNPAEAVSARGRLMSKGYETKAYYKPIRSLPGTDQLFLTSICLPVHSDVTHEDIYRMAGELRNCLRE